MAELEIVTQIKRRKVRFDGADFEMLGHDEIDLASGVKLKKLLGRLAKMDDAKESDLRELSVDLRAGVLSVIPSLPIPVLNNLKDGHCGKIVVYFYEATEPEPSPSMALPTI